MPRRARIAVLVLVAAAFLATSLLLARLLAAGSAERDAVISVVKTQSRGDADGVIDAIAGCRAEPACGPRARANVGRLQSAGKVRVLRLDGPSRLALGARTGTARIAWRAGARLPVVQCVRVRRSGDLLSGFDVEVAELGDPIGREAGCPSD